MSVARIATILIFALLFLTSPRPPALADDPLDIGSRRELFVDRWLIERIEGGVSLDLVHPQPQEVVLTTNEPWEGNTSAYFTIFQDEAIYRMYYRGSHWDEIEKRSTHPEVTCYAESKDGIHWTKPELGLFEFDGSKQNNIVWMGVGTHCFTVFKDTNPACEAAERYKAISRGRPTHTKGLYVFKSPDAIRWTLMAQQPVITVGAFDSQNLAFWDAFEGRYREYHRTFHNGVRHIMTSTSSDFIQWTEPQLLDFGDAPAEHLYTNAVRPYARAPHLLIAFPTRFLPDQGERVEPTFMSSRDRIRFFRWAEAVILESAPQDRSGNRSNYMTWGLVQLPGNDRELSVYATEAYYTGPDSRVRRFTYRTDGFVAAHAGAPAGRLITKPLQFKGDRLHVNASASPGGKLKIELQAASGQPLGGYSLADCDSVTVDAIDHMVSWRGQNDLSELEGRALRILFEIDNADLYSFQFRSDSE